MAELATAEPFIPSLMANHDDDLELEILQDSTPFWPPFVDPHAHLNLSVHHDLDDPDDQHYDFDSDVFVPVFSPEITPKAPIFSTNIDLGSDAESDVDEVSLSLDLFDQCFQQEDCCGGGEGCLDDGEIRVLDEDREMGSEYLELGVESGLGGKKGSRVVDFRSGSEDGEENDGFLGENFDGGSNGGDMDVDLPLYWDCLRIEEDRRDLNEDFEWEEVNGAVFDSGLEGQIDGRLNEEDMGAHLEVDSESEIEEEEGDDEVVVRSLEWEVLLTRNIIDSNQSLEHEDGESYLGDEHDDGYVYTSEFDVLFGQFVDHESSIKGTPPAARSVVENLHSIFLSEEDLAKNNALCAVCKDDISLDESVKQLPCLHHYHGDCILPWLGVRNTCPVCRYELPTDDVEYENWKAQRGSAGRPQEVSQERYMFEMFSED